jgi:hypothetical protein
VSRSATLNIATDKELIDFVDRRGVQTHAARAGGKIIGWYCWLPHPHPFVRVMGADWRTAIGNLKRHTEEV